MTIIIFITGMKLINISQLSFTINRPCISSSRSNIQQNYWKYQSNAIHVAEATDYNGTINKKIRKISVFPRLEISYLASRWKTAGNRVVL